MPSFSIKILRILKERKRRAKNQKKNLRYPMDTLKSLSLSYIYIYSFMFIKRGYGGKLALDLFLNAKKPLFA